MSVVSGGVFGKPIQVFKRQVSIRRDGRDFVVAFQPDNIVIFRHNEAKALRKLCRSLRWEIVSDTVPEPNDLASW